MTDTTREGGFADWFRKNYPGPDTIIHKPDWHAPKIYRAATHEIAKERDVLLTRAEAAEANGEKWRSMWEKEQSHNEELRAERDKWRGDYTRLLNDRLSGAWREELDAERDALRAKMVLAVEAMAFYGNESHYVGEHIADPCGCCGSWYEPLIHKDGQDSGNKARATLAQLTAAPKEGKDDER